MEVDFAFLADSAQVVGGKLYLVGGAFDTIWSPNLPVIHHGLSLPMKLLFSPGEMGKKYNLEINIIDEDGKRIATVNGSLEIERNPNLPPGWKQVFLTVMNFANLKFEKFGDYSFEIVADNFSLKSVPLRISQRINLQA